MELVNDGYERVASADVRVRVAVAVKADEKICVVLNDLQCAGEELEVLVPLAGEVHLEIGVSGELLSEIVCEDEVVLLLGEDSLIRASVDAAVTGVDYNDVLPIFGRCRNRESCYYNNEENNADDSDA